MTLHVLRSWVDDEVCFFPEWDTEWLTRGRPSDTESFHVTVCDVVRRKAAAGSDGGAITVCARTTLRSMRRYFGALVSL